MTTAELVSNITLVATGKLPTFATGSLKWAKILAIANNKIQIWQNEADWDSLYDPKFSLGTISATDTYPLDDTIRLVSQQPGDTVTVLRANGTKSEYQTVYAKQLKLHKTGLYCAVVGQTLVFNKSFTSIDDDFGGTILAPVYFYCDKLVNDSDPVQVDDPQWLVLVSAAEYVRNDIIKQAQYPALINEANSLMDQMKESLLPQVEDLQRPYSPLGAQW